AYPDQTSRMDMIKLYLDFKYNDRLSLRGGYWYEKYDSADWSLESVYPSTIYNLLSMGAQPQNYNQGVAWISFQYAFGKIATSEDE
ncbi:MAG: MtrB/PioB family outer membrane beta-barrel protein, partial [Gammaproteobacteria bacterium]|nr:MtrB/PioB family outer membrane beta-barrel protein [Gammaproteobacteria bacterium]